MKRLSLSLLMVITMISVTGITSVVPVQASDFSSAEIRRYQQEQEKRLMEEARFQRNKKKQVGRSVREVTITNVSLRQVDESESNILSQIGSALMAFLKSSTWLFLVVFLGFTAFVALGLRSMFRRTVFVA